MELVLVQCSLGRGGLVAILLLRNCCIFTSGMVQRCFSGSTDVAKSVLTEKYIICIVKFCIICLLNSSGPRSLIKLSTESMHRILHWQQKTCLLEYPLSHYMAVDWMIISFEVTANVQNSLALAVNVSVVSF